MEKEFVDIAVKYWNNLRLGRNEKRSLRFGINENDLSEYPNPFPIVFHCDTLKTFFLAIERYEKIFSKQIVPTSSYLYAEIGNVTFTYGKPPFIILINPRDRTLEYPCHDPFLGELEHFTQKDWVKYQLLSCDEIPVLFHLGYVGKFDKAKLQNFYIWEGHKIIELPKGIQWSDTVGLPSVFPGNGKTHIDFLNSFKQPRLGYYRMPWEDEWEGEAMRKMLPLYVYVSPELIWANEIDEDDLNRGNHESDLLYGGEIVFLIYLRHGYSVPSNSDWDHVVKLVYTNDKRRDWEWKLDDSNDILETIAERKAVEKSKEVVVKYAW
jgi:hypothetical protein